MFIPLGRGGEEMGRKEELSLVACPDLHASFSTSHVSTFLHLAGNGKSLDGNKAFVVCSSSLQQLLQRRIQKLLHSSCYWSFILLKLGEVIERFGQYVVYPISFHFFSWLISNEHPTLPFPQEVCFLTVCHQNCFRPHYP